MQQSKGREPVQPDTANADLMPCHVHFVAGTAMPMQRQAWICVWRLLLAENVDYPRTPNSEAQEDNSGQ